MGSFDAQDGSSLRASMCYSAACMVYEEMLIKGQGGHSWCEPQQEARLGARGAGPGDGGPSPLPP